MSECPSCGSKNIRIQFPGFIRNEFICMKCSHTFHRMAPGIKMFSAIGVSSLIGADLLDGEFGDGIDFGDDTGGY